MAVMGTGARKAQPFLAVGLGALMLAGCSNTENKDSADPSVASADNAPSGEVLRIGTEGAYAPFNFTNADGSLGGFDVEIAHALCEDMKVKCDIVAQDWDGIIPGLKAGKYDAIVAAMSITPERAQQVSFTEPYFSNALVFLAKDGASFDPKNEADINAHSIAAQRSTISSQWFEKAYPKADMKLYDTLSNAFLDLGAGRVDAMISDKLPALQWLGSPSGKGFTIKGDDIDINDHFAIATRPNEALTAKLNQSLAHIKANGTYDTIYQKYFSLNTAAQNKPAVTAESTEKAAEDSNK